MTIRIRKTTLYFLLAALFAAPWLSGIVYYFPLSPLPCYTAGDCTPPVIDVAMAACRLVGLGIAAVVAIARTLRSSSHMEKFLFTALAALVMAQSIDLAYHVPYTHLPCYSDSIRSLIGGSSPSAGYSCVPPVVETPISDLSIAAILTAVAWMLGCARLPKRTGNV
jgi:hypothetical protein